MPASWGSTQRSTMNEPSAVSTAISTNPPTSGRMRSNTPRRPPSGTTVTARSGWTDGSAVSATAGGFVTIPAGIPSGNWAQIPTPSASHTGDVGSVPSGTLGFVPVPPPSNSSMVGSIARNSSW